MSKKYTVWVYSLPASLLLMAPIDILASLAMDIYLPIVPAMPGILDTSAAVVQLTLSLYMVILGLGQRGMGDSRQLGEGAWQRSCWEPFC